jgi:hypothetical protein
MMVLFSLFFPLKRYIPKMEIYSLSLLFSAIQNKDSVVIKARFYLYIFHSPKRIVYIMFFQMLDK